MAIKMLMKKKNGHISFRCWDDRTEHRFGIGYNIRYGFYTAYIAVPGDGDDIADLGDWEKARAMSNKLGMDLTYVSDKYPWGLDAPEGHIILGWDYNHFGYIGDRHSPDITDVIEDIHRAFNGIGMRYPHDRDAPIRIRGELDGQSSFDIRMESGTPWERRDTVRLEVPFEPREPLNTEWIDVRPLAYGPECGAYIWVYRSRVCLTTILRDLGTVADIVYRS